MNTNIRADCRRARAVINSRFCWVGSCDMELWLAINISGSSQQDNISRGVEIWSLPSNKPLVFTRMSPGFKTSMPRIIIIVE